MIRIETRQMLGSTITVVKCFHGWRDRDGHILMTDLCDLSGEDTEQLLVAAYDSINRALKRRPFEHCVMDEASMELDWS